MGKKLKFKWSKKMFLIATLVKRSEVFQYFRSVEQFLQKFRSVEQFVQTFRSVEQFLKKFRSVERFLQKFWSLEQNSFDLRFWSLDFRSFNSQYFFPSFVETFFTSVFSFDLKDSYAGCKRSNLISHLVHYHKGHLDFWFLNFGCLDFNLLLR